ncbi:hypothetical protein NDU88_005832 [Pleurodeles waltl]|uniref:Uncharacterized protein n=1 Tax=Pleurodeles waltl TaxID=8319 RepID=A0AAV7WY76_PLEWA|nr:hypothetical protein NDU88_005832 [Pleurodeles waltl]
MRDKSGARARFGGSDGPTESWPRGTAGNVGGPGRGWGPPGRTRGERLGLSLAHCPLPAPLPPPTSPKRGMGPRAERHSGAESGPGRDRKRARVDLKACGLRPAAKKNRERRGSGSPERERNPVERIWGGGLVPRLLSCIPPSRRGGRSPELGRGGWPGSRL